MKSYLDLGNRILKNGTTITGRNGKVKALFGEQLKFDLKDGFPLLTTKYINFNHILHETIWYLKGTDKITYLKDNKINIWNLWADENDSIGPTYGVQWRDFNGMKKDQVKEAIELLRHDPHSRRIIITGWNPLQLRDMKLPPCLVLIQFHVDDDLKLHTTVYQRSADFCIGVPYDIAEMALLTHIIANIVNMEIGTLTMQYGNIHLYQEHQQIFRDIQSQRETRKLPKLEIKHILDIDNIDSKDITLRDYTSDTKIKYNIKE